MNWPKNDPNTGKVCFINLKDVHPHQFEVSLVGGWGVRGKEEQ